MKKSLLILIAGLAFTFFFAHSLAAGERDVQIHGFISQGYISTTENNFISDSQKGTFEFNEVGINFGKELTDNMHIGIQFFSRDFGETGNNEVKIDWALADYRPLDWLGIRFGQIKTPHGLYNEYRDVDALRTYVLLPQSVYPEITRDVTLSIQGGGIYGLINMDAVGRLSYQALYGTQTIDPNNNRLSETLAVIPQTFIDNDRTEVDRKYAGNLVYDGPLPGLRLGVSYDNIEMALSGKYNKEIVIFPVGHPVRMKFDTNENWVYSLEYTWENLVLMAEYMDTYRRYDNSVAGSGEFEQTGWYAGGIYRLTDWFELGGYYSSTESDTRENIGSFTFPDYYDDLTDICATLRFDINEYWLLKLEYHTLTGAKGLSAWDNPSSSPGDSIFTEDFEKNWTMFAAKLTASF